MASKIGKKEQFIANKLYIYYSFLASLNHTRDAPYDLKCSSTVRISDRTGARSEIQPALARPLLGAPRLTKTRERGVSWSPMVLEYSGIPSRIPPDCDNIGVPTSPQTLKTEKKPSPVHNGVQIHVRGWSASKSIYKLKKTQLL